MEGYFNNSDNVKQNYKILKSKKEYSVYTTYNTGAGGNNLLSNNKFYTKKMVNLTYEELKKFKYNKIYALELLPGGKYRFLNVIIKYSSYLLKQSIYLNNQ